MAYHQGLVGPLCKPMRLISQTINRDRRAGILISVMSPIGIEVQSVYVLARKTALTAAEACARASLEPSFLGCTDSNARLA